MRYPCKVWTESISVWLRKAFAATFPRPLGKAQNGITKRHNPHKPTQKSEPTFDSPPPLAAWPPPRGDGCSNTFAQEQKTSPVWKVVSLQESSGQRFPSDNQLNSQESPKFPMCWALPVSLVILGGIWAFQRNPCFNFGEKTNLQTPNNSHLCGHWHSNWGPRHRIPRRR